MSDPDNSKPVLWFYRLTQIFLLALYRFFFRFQSFGTENVPNDSRGVIFAPNHASYLDPPILGISLKKHVTYLAKDYLFKNFILRNLIRWLGAIPIRSQTDYFRSMRLVLRALKTGKHILIFREGTRSIDGQFQKVEAGVGFLAVKSRAHVVPVYIKGTFEAYPKSAKGWRFKCHPVRVYFGKSFIPALDSALMSESNPYLAVSEKIMIEIKKIKEEVV